MNATSLLHRISHLPRRIVRESLMVLSIIRFFLINRFGSKPVVEPGGPIVSLTTYGKRSERVYYAIESIAGGEVRPSRLILWIDNESLLNRLPATICRLVKRGLEVKFSRNYGPHTKYYPYVESEDCFDIPLVTADDDMLYPKYWLKKLIAANQEFPNAVNCFWAHIMNVDNDGIGRYDTYKVCSSTQPSFRHIALGVMGVIYPPSYLMVLKNAGAAFKARCPKGDDLWLHVQALRAGYKVRQILPKLPYFSFHVLPGTQQSALSYGNVTYGDGNDQQIRATYTEMDLTLLRLG